MPTYKIAGYDVEICSNGPDDNAAYTLPCLGGADVNRHPATLIVEARGGRLVKSNYGEPLTISVGETLRGWGTLDGPSYAVQPEGCAWHVNVPMDLLQAVAQRLGATIPQ